MRSVNRGLLALVAAASILVMPTGALATSGKKQIKAATTAAVAYLKSLQQPSGAFETDWTLGALAAAKVAPSSLSVEGGPDARTYYRQLVGDPSTWPEAVEPSVGEFERAALNGYAAGIDPARVSGAQNLLAQIVARYQPASPGYYGTPAALSDTVFGVLALADTSVHKGPRVPEALLAKSVTALKANQHTDGGWTYERGEGNPTKLAQPAEPDETGATIAALCGAGVPVTDPSLAKALAYLKGDLVDSSGAFESPFGANTDSTAWAVQGLDACGIDPQSAEFTTAAGKTPIDYLISQQIAGGGFVYEAGEAEANEYSSQDALRAIAGGGFTAKPAAGHNGPKVEAEGSFQKGVPDALALIVEYGATLQACSVTLTPEAVTTTLLKVLEAARAGSTPSGCVTSFQPAAGNVDLTQLDGSPASPAPDWKLSIDGGKAKTAKLSSKVAIGDTLYLQLG